MELRDLLFRRMARMISDYPLLDSRFPFGRKSQADKKALVMDENKIFLCVVVGELEPRASEFNGEGE